MAGLVYMQKNIYFFYFMSMYRLKSDWNFLLKILYCIWRIIWIACITNTVILSFLDILFRNDIEQIADVALNIMNILLFSSITTRASYWVTYIEEVEDLIALINLKYREYSKAIEPISMEYSRKLANRVFAWWMFFVLCAGMFMAADPMFRSERALSLPMWFYYDWRLNPFYQITVLFQSATQVFMVISFGNLDMFNACFTVLLADQFKILASSFDNVFSISLFDCGCTKEEIEQYTNYIDTNLSDTTRQKMDDIIETVQFKNILKQHFNNCIEHHQDLLIIVNKFQSFISPLLLIETAFIFCYLIFMLYIVATNDNASLYLALSQYLGGSVAQIFMLGFFGDRFNTDVENVRTALYGIPWYFCDLKFLNTFKIVQLRMTKTIYIYAGKVLPMNLETFLEIMKKAFSFFTVLRQVDE